MTVATSISFACPKCGKQGSIESSIPAGTKVRCPACKHSSLLGGQEPETGLRSMRSPTVPVTPSVAIEVDGFPIVIEDHAKSKPWVFVANPIGTHIHSWVAMDWFRFALWIFAIGMMAVSVQATFQPTHDYGQGSDIGHTISVEATNIRALIAFVASIVIMAILSGNSKAR